MKKKYKIIGTVLTILIIALTALSIKYAYDWRGGEWAIGGEYMLLALVPMVWVCLIELGGNKNR